jgi:hypothetical protein
MEGPVRRAPRWGIERLRRDGHGKGVLVEGLCTVTGFGDHPIPAWKINGSGRREEILRNVRERGGESVYVCEEVASTRTWVGCLARGLCMVTAGSKERWYGADETHSEGVADRVHARDMDRVLRTSKDNRAP